MNLRSSLNALEQPAWRATETPVELRGHRELRDSSSSYRSLRAQLHRQILETVDLVQLDTLSAERVHERLTNLIEQAMTGAGVALNSAERRQIVVDVIDEITGLGPLEPLLSDATVSDILVNSPEDVFVERAGRLERTPVRFDDDQHLMTLD